MRRRLALAAVALTTTVLLAFCIPIARLIRDIARDQAIAVAERDVERVVGALSVTVDPSEVDPVLQSTEAGADGRLGIVFADGSTLGEVGAAADAIELARVSPTAFTVGSDGDIVLVAPVELGDGVAVVSVVVPAAEVTRGVTAGWTILGGVAVVLLLVGVAMADRLARSVTRPAVALADAARRVADGDLSVVVEPSGPPELARAATGFNDLTGRLSDLVTHERQAVADLAHRLRTPVAAMRLDVEGVDDPATRERLAADVTELERSVDTVIREARHPISRAVTPRCDLVEVTGDRVAFWAALAEDQGRPWSADLADTALVVGMPRTELEAVVDALLDNVFTHTPVGAAFEVRVRQVGPNRARLEVRDHGPGFGGWRPGATTATATTVGRTGLGVDITARAAEAAGGTLELFDDDGAVAAVELPLVADGAPVPPADRRRHRLADGEPDQFPSSTTC